MTTAALQFLFYIFPAVVLARYLFPFPSVARTQQQGAGHKRVMPVASNSAGQH